MNSEQTSAVGVFEAVASGFCAWCEGPSLGAEPEVVAALWLAKLYAAALSLPNVGPENEEGLPSLPEAEANRAKANLACFNGSYYREYFDPDPSLDEESVMGDIGDDLLDTYKDVKAGLVLFKRGNPQEALWHWRFLHRIHWGRHAVGALFALHCLSISNKR
jgi:hypothetical protein